MIGNGYWSTGIVVAHSDYHGGAWTAKVSYLDAGFCDDNPAAGHISTEGTLHTRYRVEGDSEMTLTVIVNVIKADAERLGITWMPDCTIFYDGDGENVDYPPPEGWRELVDAQSQRLGWRPIYGGVDAR